MQEYEGKNTDIKCLIPIASWWQQWLRERV